MLKRLNESGSAVIDLSRIAVKGFINMVLIIINCEVVTGSIVKTFL